MARNRKNGTDKELTRQEEVACQQYVLNNGNQSDAFRKAFPQSKRWKDNTVYNKASLFYARSEVKQRVKEIRLEMAKVAREEFKIDARYVLERLHAIDNMDVIDILDDDGNMLPVRKWPKVWRTSLSGIDINRLRTIGSEDSDEQIESVLQKIKWPDKVKNLELIGKHVEVMAFKDQMDHSSSDGSMTPYRELSDEELQRRIREHEERRQQKT